MSRQQTGVKQQESIKTSLNFHPLKGTAVVEPNIIDSVPKFREVSGLQDYLDGLNDVSKFVVVHPNFEHVKGAMPKGMAMIVDHETPLRHGMLPKNIGSRYTVCQIPHGSLTATQALGLHGKAQSICDRLSSVTQEEGPRLNGVLVSSKDGSSASFKDGAPWKPFLGNQGNFIALARSGDKGDVKTYCIVAKTDAGKAGKDLDNFLHAKINESDKTGKPYTIQDFARSAQYKKTMELAERNAQRLIHHFCEHAGHIRLPSTRDDAAVGKDEYSLSEFMTHKPQVVQVNTALHEVPATDHVGSKCYMITNNVGYKPSVTGGLCIAADPSEEIYLAVQPHLVHGARNTDPLDTKHTFAATTGKSCTASGIGAHMQYYKENRPEIYHNALEQYEDKPMDDTEVLETANKVFWKGKKKGFNALDEKDRSFITGRYRPLQHVVNKNTRKCYVLHDHKNQTGSEPSATANKVIFCIVGR